MEGHVEIEHKYEVRLDAQVPVLTGLPEVAAADPPRELTLQATYFDTAAHALTGAGATLRRRTGGDDDGWHLKLPVGPDEREEIHLPTRPDADEAATTVPQGLRSLVQVHLRGLALTPVATLTTRRVVIRLRAEDDTVLAELCDDHVTAEVAQRDGSVTTSEWREWELELVRGTRTLLEEADRLLLGAGARTSRTGSKVARALGAPGAGIGGSRDSRPSAKGPAGAPILAYLCEHVAKLKEQDPHVRRGRPDAVHKMRVATRRTRSALASFKPLLEDHEGTAHLREELKWLASVLGDARDAEVLRDRLTSMAADDAAQRDSPGDAASGPATDLAAQLAARHDDAHTRVLQILDSTRYFRLLDALDLVVGHPPWSPDAEEPARDVLPPLVRRDWRRVKRQAAAAQRAKDANERDVHLHEARKAAKRLRYACEALAPVFGTPAEALAAAARDLQEVLGEHQDSVVSQALLRELAGHQGLSGNAVLGLGRLQLIEQSHAERARGHFETAWKEVSAKRNRRWLKS